MAIKTCNDYAPEIEVVTLTQEEIIELAEAGQMKVKPKENEVANDSEQ